MTGLARSARGPYSPDTGNEPGGEMPLYRSKRGDVACAEHAPLTDVTRWQLEGWHRVVPDDSAAAIELHCRQCETLRDAEPPGRKPLILNVDDRPPTLYGRERLLRLRGFAVVNATTAATAIETATRVRPSLVLLDVHLPDGDGRDICRRLKQDPDLAKIPVVIISSTMKGYVDNLESLRWGGADGYISEPVEPEVLESTLRHALASSI